MTAGSLTSKKKHPKVRMIAGPNGSGKSTLIHDLREQVNFGFYLNADDIQQYLMTGAWDLAGFPIHFTNSDFQEHLKSSGFRSKEKSFGHLKIKHNKLIAETTVNAYDAAAITDYIRQKFLENRVKFSFETVMSHHSKLKLLEQARSLGYRNYLYFIATESPVINVERVGLRTSKGGHPVSETKIISRYHKSLGLLLDAVRLADRAFLFDNSSDRYHLFAEIVNNRVQLIPQATIPRWFTKYVEEKLF